ncbi:hypothetical protein CROQUDRAFT_720718 [Cronartium quercuum f. sp. fusiforme G11]|uniref:PAC domain-containing protein n=1 Tax=Cronartium quercuum f. sp. fusiforme G11 TaxID=708437 RepID=A0A9P6TFQ9_9BASI|nr:hypothetical protein CROQUDRAFT_720718 [Cronartium quercuum f. sp. fusiforme G11]
MFRKWLDSSQNVSVNDDSGSGSRRSGLVKLDRWTDELKCEAILKKLKDQSQLVHDLYYGERRPEEAQLDPLPEQADEHSANNLLEMANHKMPELAFSRFCLVRSMFADEFRRFIISKLVKLTTGRLGGELASDMGALAEAFVLTNPRAKDNPIVMASPGFTSMTGYTLQECIGKNPGMLYGPGTSPNARKRIKNAEKSLRPCMELIINYRKDGTPFHCLLHIAPLFDIQGEITYFFAGQVDVTSELQSPNLLEFLYTTEKEKVIPKKRESKTSSAVVSDSPLMCRFKSGEAMVHHRNIIRETIGDEPYLDQNEVADRKFINLSNTSPKRMTIPWISSLNRKRKNTTESKKAPDVRSLQSGGRNSDKISFSTIPHAPILEATYARIVVFKRKSLEIIFATPGTLVLLGLPARTDRDVNMSALLQMKITDLLYGATPKLTHTLRSGVSDTVKRGGAVSCSCLLSHSLDQSTKSQPKKLWYT